MTRKYAEQQARGFCEQEDSTYESAIGSWSQNIPNGIDLSG
jgi:hypothetical protein